ncbi:MAG TPA: DNA polymerase III subunit delta [Thermoleophilaceae bacterium]|nr:DNA polymerase III subunit delta [Thermoleophilaceae bacterium]
MADLKPVYLVCGDDDAKIDAWRARLRKRADDERGPGGLEGFDARQSDPAEVAGALAMLSFDPGTRYLLVDDVGAWKANQLGPLEDALADLPPETVLVLVARGKATKQLSKAVDNAGGETREYAAPKPWELPKWCIGHARELGLQLDGEAAKVLVARVGTSQQRLSRELEKIGLTLHPSLNVTAADVERLAASDTAPGAYDLADALVAGDLKATLALAEQLDEHGERPARLLFPVVRRLREVHQAAALLATGMPDARVGELLKGPPWATKKVIAKAKKADVPTLERAICVFADLEVELRGGGELRVDEDAAFSVALARATG